VVKKNGRGGEIRTHDLLYPKQARYQATLRPDPGQEKVPVDAALGKKFMGALGGITKFASPQIRNSKIEIRNKFENRIENVQKREHEIFKQDRFFEPWAGVRFWKLTAGESNLQ
jgi:hypothetical protein